MTLTNRLSTGFCVMSSVLGVACAVTPLRGIYDDPVAAAEAESTWSMKLTEADLESLASAAGARIEACLASEPGAPELRVLPVEDRTGKTADTVTLAERMHGGLLRGGKVRPSGTKARFRLSSVLEWDASGSEYRFLLALSEEGNPKVRCDEQLTIAKAGSEAKAGR